MNYKQLSKILRYTFTTKEDFERKIDENPFDWQTRLVYSDWLQEHEDPEEAAFQTSMSNWIREKGNAIYNAEGENKIGWYGPGWAAGGALHWPEGTLSNDPVDILSNFEYPRMRDIPATERAGPLHRPATGHITETHHPIGRRNDQIGAETNPEQTYDLRWDTYRGMEEAMRRAFKNNKKREQNG